MCVEDIMTEARGPGIGLMARHECVMPRAGCASTRAESVFYDEEFFTVMAALVCLHLVELNRGRCTFSWRGRSLWGEGAMLFVATMSHLLCSLLPSYASSIGMGSRTPSCWRIGAGQGLVTLAADSPTLEPCAGSEKTCLMWTCVLVFFTASRGCWIFSLFVSHFLSLLSHLVLCLYFHPAQCQSRLVLPSWRGFSHI